VSGAGKGPVGATGQGQSQGDSNALRQTTNIKSDGRPGSYTCIEGRNETTTVNPSETAKMVRALLDWRSLERRGSEGNKRPARAGGGESQAAGKPIHIKGMSRLRLRVSNRGACGEGGTLALIRKLTSGVGVSKTSIVENAILNHSSWMQLMRVGILDGRRFM